MAGELEAIREALKGMTILVVPYCHADWAWMHTRRWHERRYVLVLDEVLDILAAQDEAGIPHEAAEAYRWYTDCWITQIATYLETRPERAEELRTRIAEGRIAICGGYANVRVNHVPGEIFVRALVLGRRRWREHFPEADLSVHSDLVDVAVGHPQLPQLLRLAGYDFLQFWRPETALNEKGLPHQFIWEGLDGTQVLAVRGSYGGLIQPQYAPRDFAERWDEVVRYWWDNALSYKRGRAPTSILWLNHGSDDSRPLRTGPPTDLPLHLPGVISTWNERETSRMRFATPVQAFALLTARREELPVIKGTLDPIDVAYNAAWGGELGLWRRREEAARAIGLAEMLATLWAGMGGPAVEQERFDDLWRDALLFSAHATQWLFQDDFDELAQLAERTLTDARRAQQQTLGELAARIDCPEDAQQVLFNPLPCAREVTVPVLLSFVRGDRGGAPEALRLLDGEGREVPCQALRPLRCGGRTWEYEALARVAMPAGGWTVLRAEAARPAQAPAPPIEDAVSISNDLLTLEFDRGRLMNMIERTGRAWSARGETPFAHLRAYNVDVTKPLHVGPIVGRTDAVWQRWRVTEAGPLRWTYRSEGAVGACPVALEARLYAGEPRAEFAVEVQWDGRNGFLAALLPYPEQGELVGDMPFCVENKPLWDEHWVGIERTRPGMFIARSFVDWTADGHGIAYLSHDGDRYYYMDLEEHELAHILVNSVAEPYADWEESVNRQMRGVGRHRFTFSLVPHAGDWREAGLPALSERLRTPVLQTRPRGRGDLPMAGSLLAVAPETVALSACYTDGDRVLVRVYDATGDGGRTAITLPFAVSAAERVDLNGEPMDGPEVHIEERTVALELRPWEIMTVAVRA